jgi:hypothetical protein
VRRNQPPDHGNARDNYKTTIYKPFGAPAAPASAPGGPPGDAPGHAPRVQHRARDCSLVMRPGRACSIGTRKNCCADVCAVGRCCPHHALPLPGRPPPGRPTPARRSGGVQRQVPGRAEVCSTVARCLHAPRNIVPHVATHTHVCIVLEAAWEKQTCLVPDSSERTQVINGVQTSA